MSRAHAENPRGCARPARWSFPGGLVLEGYKGLSTGHPVRPLELPREIVLPLQQHIGEPAEPVVQVGEEVLKGQMVARASGYVSVPVHASTSGRVVEIGPRPVLHPSGLAAPCIVIEPDGEDRWLERRPLGEEYRSLDPSALRNRIRSAGIGGLGGAGFPTFIKLNPGSHRPDVLVVNGAECEPYITCDDMLMRERAADIVSGIGIIRHALGVERCLIGIEDNKPQAIAAMCAAVAASDCGHALEVIEVPARYPAGGEKQLIYALTGREVPSQGLPLDVGVVCHNVGTAAAVHEAIMEGRPLVSRVVTVTGHGIAEPANLEVPVGAPVAALIEACGGTGGEVTEILVGGPMMGFTLLDRQAPVVKTTNCILVATARDAPPAPQPLPCIRCGACAEVCPALLLPQQLYWLTHARDLDRVQDYNLFDCIECGCCAWVCPSHIPLVHYYRYAKTEIWALEREREKAERARRRHEARLARLEREKRERAARLKARQRPAGDDAKARRKAEVKAALERVQQRRGAGADDPAGGEG